MTSKQLRARTLRTQNLKTATEWLQNDLPMSTRLRESLERLLGELLESDSVKGVVIEELGAQGEVRQLAALGLSVFLEDKSFDAYLSARRPFLLIDILEKALAGKESGILDRRQIAKANSGDGLNLLVLYMQRGWDLSDPHWRAVATLGHEAYVIHHRGYHLKRALQEDWASNTAMYTTNGGYRALGTVSVKGVALPIVPPEDERVFLYADREEVLRRAPGSTVAYVFEHRRPRFGFAASEQRVLIRALEGSTDIEIADQLGLSLTTVKHAWKRIYERASSVAPFVIGEDIEDGRRGQEKRRKLLVYLEDHPEELRPYANK